MRKLEPLKLDLPLRDIQILELADKGYSDKHIAEELGLARKSVSNRLGRLYDKFDLKNRRQAVLWYRLEYSPEFPLDAAPQIAKSVNKTFELRDHIGLWCARCLGYLEPGENGACNPYTPTSELGKALSWTVTVHRGRCYFPPHALASFSDWEIWELENKANELFARGNLNINMWLRLILSHKRYNGGDVQQAVIERVKANISNAGSTLSQNIEPILWPKSMSSVLMPALNDMPYYKVQYYLSEANRLRNIGNPDYAERVCFDKAKWLIETKIIKRTIVEHTWGRRYMTVSRNVTGREAENAIEYAKQDSKPYARRTAYHNVAWLYLRDEKYQKAENYFLNTFEEEPGEIISWWHKMAGWLGLATALYVSDPSNYDEPLGFCLKAEYVSAMLGLRVDVTRGVSKQVLQGYGALLSPSDVVQKIGQERGVSKEQMEKIRHRVLIESGLQNELFSELNRASGKW